VRWLALLLFVGAAGCWQVVGAVGGQTLTFVVRVAPE